MAADTIQELKLSDKQKEVIQRLRESYFLYENRVTPGARWSLGKFEKQYRWGSVNGNVIDKIKNLIEEKTLHFGVSVWTLNELGKTIKI